MQPNRPVTRDLSNGHPNHRARDGEGVGRNGGGERRRGIAVAVLILLLAVAVVLVFTLMEAANLGGPVPGGGPDGAGGFDLEYRTVPTVGDAAPRGDAARPGASGGGVDGDGVLRIDLHERFHIESFRVGVVHPLTRIPLAGTPQEGVLALPGRFIGETLYGAITLGRARLAFPIALHFAGTGSGSPVLYVDRNRNGDLTDDGGAIVNRGTGLFAAGVSIPLRELSPQWSSDGPYELWIFTNESLWRNNQLSYYARTQMVGRITIDGRDLLAVVADHGVHDGDFGNDGIYLDLDRNGEIDIREEYIPPGGEAELLGRRYRIETSW